MKMEKTKLPEAQGYGTQKMNTIINRNPNSIGK